MGVKALGDIADDILVLDEIRQRFRKGRAIEGYANWTEFVEKNSKYGIRTIQKRLNQVNGVRPYEKFDPVAAVSETNEIRLCVETQEPEPSQTAGRKTWTEEQVFDWLKEKHPAVYAHYEDRGFPRWIPLPPSVETTDKASCEYCISQSSSRSCPIHGWTEKRDHARENATAAPAIEDAPITDAMSVPAAARKSSPQPTLSLFGCETSQRMLGTI